MPSENLEFTIHRKQIVDLIAPWLHAIKKVPYSSEITNIQFSDLFGAGDTELVKIKVFLDQKEDKEMEVRFINENENF